MKLTEKNIQNELFSNFNNASEIMVPNFTPNNWHECDVFRITKNGYFYEYEIKLSKADFLKDFKKRQSSFQRMNLGSLKMDRLTLGDETGPKFFYYVMPAELVDKVYDAIPEWAGIIKAITNKRRKTMILTLERKAKELHKVRIKTHVIDKAKSVFYWRYWLLRIRNEKK